MAEIKKVFIKIDGSGAIEVSCKDPGVAILVQYPDGATTVMQRDEKNVWENHPEFKNLLKRF